MYPPSNQLQASDDEEEDKPEELEDGDNWKSKDSSAIKEPGQETFYGYYNQNFGQTQNFRVKSLDAQNEKWADFVCSGAVSTASNPMKISNERLIQEDFNLASPKLLKAKKRKAEVIEVHGGGGGGRVVWSTGRRDRHSKVRTARGPKDRRVRLSPRTAIQFYDVQDRLGYDRPSKAIDWLIQEAKTAIDALDEQPRNNHFIATNAAENHSPPIPNRKSQQMQQDCGKFLISESGMIQKLEHLNDENPVSGFSLAVEGAATSSSTELQAYLDQDSNPSRNRREASEDAILYASCQQGFCSVLTETSQVLETNWEMARLQKMLTWNYGNENSGDTRGGGGGGGGVGYSSVNFLPLHSPAEPISGHGHMFSQREPLQSSIINYSPIGTDFPGFNFFNELSNITAAATLKENEKDKKLVFSRPSSTAPFLRNED